MNDRHRQIEKIRKQQEAKSNYFLNDLGKAITKMADCVVNTITDAFKAVKKFADDIKNMPEDEFQKFMEEHVQEFTADQIILLHRLRGDGKNGEPANGTESVG